MAVVPAFHEAHLRAICDVLGHTETGLTGSEIEKLLRACAVTDTRSTITKKDRLFEALAARQVRDHCGNNVIAFIRAAMDPVRYTGRSGEFEERRSALNERLAFCGLSLGEDGSLRQTTAVRTLTEAQEKAGRLRAELQRRRVHPDVLRFCRSELLQANYFHSVFETAKSVAEKLREKSGLTLDGAELVDKACGLGQGAPRLAFNSLQTETEQSEQRGLVNLLKGLFGAFRNVTAHAPKITWAIEEQDALDLLSLASLLHRRLDRAVPTTRP
jgi:uncharacterized protein (TIGR02391 family)